MKLLLYCTKNKWRLFFDKVKQVFTLGKVKSNNDLNGKIVAECDFEVEDIENVTITNINASHLQLLTNKLTEEELFKHSCLSRYEMFNYLKKGFSKADEPRGYAIHIKNLHIFDEPKELGNYITKQCQFGKCATCKYGKNDIHCATIDTPITKAPQNMMYAYDSEGNKYIVISIQPQWLCKILNGEKTIEVRKKVLKEMLKDDK